MRRDVKTSLAQALDDVEYFDCELLRVRRAMEDPEAFLMGLKDRRIVLDEIHRLPNPSELLKIAADHLPGTHFLATGSSTLGASSRFRDTLAGRKTELWLTPMIEADLKDFRSYQHQKCMDSIQVLSALTAAGASCAAMIADGSGSTTC